MKTNSYFPFFSRFYLEELELQKLFCYKILNKKLFLDNALVVPFKRQYVFVHMA